MRSRVNVKLGGESRTVKFTLGTFYKYDEKHGEGASLRIIQGNPMTAILPLTVEGLDGEYDIDTVDEWLDELPKVEYKKLFDGLMNALKKMTGVLETMEIK